MSLRILYLSRSLPPGTSGSAVIAWNLARQFRPDEMVVVGEKPADSPDVVWPPGSPDVHYVLDVGGYDNRRGIHWLRRLCLPFSAARVTRLARRYHVNTVLTVYPREENLVQGMWAARRTGAAFFPYFHNTYETAREGFEQRLARWLQPRVFKASRHVFVMSEGMVDLFRERYPGVPCSALLHSFNEPLPAFREPSPPGPVLRFALSGNINRTNEDAACRIAEVIRVTPDTELAIYSGTARAHLERLGLLRGRVSLQTLSRDELLRRLPEADVLLLPHGLQTEASEAERLTIFPTKTIEYLISGRPILAHTPADCYLTRFLREHDCALVVDRPDPAALREAIGRLRTDAELRARLVRNALTVAERFQAARVADGLRATLLRHLH